MKVELKVKLFFEKPMFLVPPQMPINRVLESEDIKVVLYPNRIEFIKVVDYTNDKSLQNRHTIKMVEKVFSKYKSLLDFMSFESLGEIRPVCEISCIDDSFVEFMVYDMLNVVYKNYYMTGFDCIEDLVSTGKREFKKRRVRILKAIPKEIEPVEWEQRRRMSKAEKEDLDVDSEESKKEEEVSFATKSFVSWMHGLNSFVYLSSKEAETEVESFLTALWRSITAFYDKKEEEHKNKKSKK